MKNYKGEDVSVYSELWLSALSQRGENWVPSVEREINLCKDCFYLAMHQGVSKAEEYRRMVEAKRAERAESVATDRL